MAVILNRVTPSRLRPNHYRHYRQRYMIAIPDMFPDKPIPEWYLPRHIGSGLANLTPNARDFVQRFSTG